MTILTKIIKFLWTVMFTISLIIIPTERLFSIVCLLFRYNWLAFISVTEEWCM